MTNQYFKNKWYLILPLVSICILIWIVPFIYQVYISFYKFNLNYPDSVNQFNGVKNYTDSFSNDQYFLNSVFTTFKFSGVCLFFEILLGLIVALILIELPEKFAQTIITFLIIPFAIAPSIVGLIWYFQFNPDFGPFSILLKRLSFMDETLLGEKYAFFSVSLVDIWQNTPFMVMIFYSALKAIPKSVLDAIKVDRLNYSIKLKNIFIGYILPIFLIAIFLRFLGLFKTFDTIHVLTGGGPSTITETFSLYSQRLNYRELNFGIGAAQGVLINYFLIFIFSYLFRKLKLR